MEKPESLAEFYSRKFDWVPDALRSGLGHFNVFRLEPFLGEKPQPVPYKRRDYYKIMLVTGQSRVHYADQVIGVQHKALSFSSPLIPYKWEHLDQAPGGFFCIFDEHFYHPYGDPGRYAVFQPGGAHIFELTDAQAEQVAAVFGRMAAELESDYIHKYDVLRNLVSELLHFAMKMQPSARLEQHPAHAAQRISALFLELLERQFPIDDTHAGIRLRTASDFAAQLHVHVNHLNRVVKEALQKTTSQIIAGRILQEAKILLRHSRWNVSEIAFALGFREAAHFSHFFRRHTGLSPAKFRAEG